MEEFLTSFGLPDFLVQTVGALGYAEPTDVQREFIPKILEQQAVQVKSPTGTGKTATFAIPIITSLAKDPYGVFALVLTPTRELAIQIQQQFQALGARMYIKVAGIVGGQSILSQQQELVGKRPHVVVATPGRLLELMDSTDIWNVFRGTKFLVRDECDFMKSDPQLNEAVAGIKRLLPKNMQKLNFSATLENVQTVGVRADLSEKFLLVPAQFKDSYLLQLLKHFKGKSFILFVPTCKEAEILHRLIGEFGFDNLPLQSKMSQRMRTFNLDAFKSQRVQGLVCTDVASRGLDLPRVHVVINYNVPKKANLYLHRVGRTARAGKSGLAVTLVTQYDVSLVLNIETKLDIKLDPFLPDDEYKKLENAVLDNMSKVTNTREVLKMHVDKETKNAARR